MSRLQTYLDSLRRVKGLGKALDLLKAHREVILYLIFGGLTTLVSIASFWLGHDALGLNEHVSNVISWILAVTFAFLTNRRWVWPQERMPLGALLRQAASFYAGRLFTLIVEEVILYVFVTRLQWHALAVKTAAQVVVIVMNYVISKLVVFRKNPGSRAKP